MTDTAFVSSVAVLLIAGAGEEERAWHGAGLLADVVRAGLVAEPAAEENLAVVLAGRASARQALDLARAVQRCADADPALLAAVRGLVVDAYADPAVVARLPDPSPRL